MKCPSDTQDLVNQNDISNFVLRYQHFLSYEDNGGKVKFSVDATTIGDSQDVLDPLRDRQTNQLNYLAKTYHVSCEFYEVDWRMVIGLGGEHVQETSMTLDHVYGVPYIPGSAFKGVVRSWVIQEDFSNNEELAMRDANFFKVFGSQESAGKVQFLPAYPTGKVTLSLDIMNPHFPDYYTGPELPTDTQDPKPINFLTIGQTPFRFVLLSKDQNLINLVQDWVDRALREKGLGAKTAVGYGYFRQQYSVQRSLRPDANFQVPLKTRHGRPQQISLDEAFRQFSATAEPNPSPQLIDITPIKNYAAELAQVATRETVKINDSDQLGGIRNELSYLIDDYDDEVMISEFGKWIWENLKANLLSSRILELPCLVYSTAFRKSLKRLPADELVAVQEELIAISNQLEKSEVDLKSVVVVGHSRYETDTNERPLKSCFKIFAELRA